MKDPEVKRFNDYIDAIREIHRDQMQKVKDDCEARIKVIIERRDPLSLEEAAQVLFNNNDRGAYYIESVTVKDGIIIRITKIDG